MALGVTIVIITVLLAVTLHEAMHAYAGFWLGDDTAQLHGRLTLNPIKHLDPFGSLILPVFLFIFGLPVFGAAKPVPFNPNRVRYGDYGAAMVALAGPLTNLLFALAAGLTLRFGALELGTIGYEIFNLFVNVNLGFFVFNMIPFPPLDGSRLLYALAPDGVRDVMRRIESYGIVGVFILIMFLSGPIGDFIGRAIMALRSIIIG